MVNPIKKLFIVFICLALVACARSPKVIDEESLSFSIAEDITQLEIDASLQNINLHTAIAIAVCKSIFFNDASISSSAISSAIEILSDSASIIFGDRAQATSAKHMKTVNNFFIELTI